MNKKEPKLKQIKTPNKTQPVLSCWWMENWGWGAADSGTELSSAPGSGNTMWIKQARCGLWCSWEWWRSPASLSRPQEVQQLLWTCWPWAAEQWDVRNQSPSSKQIYGSCWEHRKRPGWVELLSFFPKNYLVLFSFMPSLNDHPIHHALFVSKDHEKQAEIS